MTKSETNKKYYQKNKEKIAKQRKQYYHDYFKKNKAKKLAYHKKWREKNKDYNNEYREKNKKKIANRLKREIVKRRITRAIYEEKNKDKLDSYRKNYRAKHKDNFRKYFAVWSKNNIKYKIRSNLSRRIIRAIQNNQKSGSTIELLGCSIEEFKDYIASQFQGGMTWDNYGINGWELDHIYPCAKFNLEQPYEQKICFNWFNYQPLWAEDNRRKSAKINI